MTPAQRTSFLNLKLNSPGPVTFKGFSPGKYRGRSASLQSDRPRLDVPGGPSRANVAPGSAFSERLSPQSGYPSEVYLHPEHR